MNTTKKQIGTINWFHDNTKNSNYGFIKHPLLGDLFFHEENIIKGQDLKSFIQNEVVIFIPQTSKKYQGKLEAIEVTLLSNENDLRFLLDVLYPQLIHKNGNLTNGNTQESIIFRVKNLLSVADELLNKELFLEYKIFSFNKIELNSNLEAIKYYLNICKNLFPHQYKDFASEIEIKSNIEINHNLWLQKYTNTCQHEYISENIFIFKKYEQELIFKICTELEKIKIFDSIIQEYIANINSNIDNIIKVLDFSRNFSGNLHEGILNNVLSKCSVYQKLNLWIRGFHNELNFNEYKIFTIALTAEDQKKFIKKTLQYIHEGKALISIEELTSINIINYHTSKSLEITDEMHLDYSTSIILNVISNLNNQIRLETKEDKNKAKFKILDLILNQIKNPSDILEIEGYFDECKGRCDRIIKHDENDANSITYFRSNPVEYYQNKDTKKYHLICDGTKYIDKNGYSVLCEKNNVEYWWCANKKCYKPSRATHTSQEWERYTLLDFLKILKINFFEQDFEIYLNLINKTNSFLKHLKCRECDNILRPVGKSNFAFYGVNRFHCTHLDCKEHRQVIYLNHCSNSKCEHAIDSRNSVQCSNGLYICNYCHSCCSTYQINLRIKNLESRGQSFNGSRIGHSDLGIILCSECGSEMKFHTASAQEFSNVLNWFNENKNNSMYIGKHGSTTNSNWFIFIKSDHTAEEFKLKLNYYLSIGFSIPNIDKIINNQLISAPINLKQQKLNILNCTHCNNSTNFSNDTKRRKALENSHRKLFNF